MFWSPVDRGGGQHPEKERSLCEEVSSTHNASDALVRVSGDGQHIKEPIPEDLFGTSNIRALVQPAWKLAPVLLYVSVRVHASVDSRLAALACCSHPGFGCDKLGRVILNRGMSYDKLLGKC